MEINTYPSTSLRNILPRKSTAELRTLANAYYVKGYSKMNKHDLAESVCAELQVPERMEELLYVIDDPVWRMFQQAVDAPGAIKISGDELPACRALEALCYLQCENDGDAPCIFIPDEIKEVFGSLVSGGFLARKARFDLLFRYAAAAANLYGVISQNDFVDLFNRQNAQKTSIDEIFPVLIRYVAVESGSFCFWDGYLVNDEFEENEFRDVPDLLAEIGNKPRYIPDKKELLRYADPDYFEKTPHTAKLERFLIQSLGQSAGAAEEIVAEIHFAIAVEAGVQAIFDILDEYSVALHDKQLTALLPLITNMTNSTRLWANNGHTPEEIFREFSSRKSPQELAIKKKIGRNDSCPCGSGKKYKRCCGR